MVLCPQEFPLAISHVADKLEEDEEVLYDVDIVEDDLESILGGNNHLFQGHKLFNQLDI